MPSNEWPDENAERAFPFRASVLEAGSSPPRDFLLGMRLFFSAYQELDVHLSEIAYESVDDTYSLTFSSDDGVVLVGSLSRRNGSFPRIGEKTVLGSGEKVVVFTPGASWDEPSWGGVGSWVLNWTAAVTAFEPSVVLPGPRTFRRLLIDEEIDPRGGVWPVGLTQTLVGGYNVSLAPTVLSNFTPPGDAVAIEIEAGPGLGLGYPPAEAEINYVRKINGVGPDERGNLQLSGFDCLRVSTPIADNEPVPFAQQLESDCSPCCPCSSYRKVSAAISRRSEKIKLQCQILKSLQEDAAEAFAIGQSYIESHVESAGSISPVVCRDPLLTRTTFSFSVQNRAPYPVYAYVALSFLNLTPTESVSRRTPTTAFEFPDVESFREVVDEDQPALVPLIADGVGADIFPENVSEEGGWVVRLGYNNQDGQLHPIPGGASCLVVFNFIGGDMRIENARLRLRAVYRFGNALQYGRHGDTMDITVRGYYENHYLEVS